MVKTERTVRAKSFIVENCNDIIKSWIVCRPVFASGRDADIEGHAAEMAEFYRCLRDARVCEYKRCAVELHGEGRGLIIWSPRNSLQKIELTPGQRTELLRDLEVVLHELGVATQ
jgi:hypothetical protein